MQSHQFLSFYGLQPSLSSGMCLAPLSEGQRDALRGSTQLSQTVDLPTPCDRLPIMHRATGINNQERAEDASE